MNEAIKALFLEVAKVCNLTTATQCMDERDGLLAKTMLVVEEAPGKVLVDAVAEVVRRSKENANGGTAQPQFKEGK